MIEFQRNIATYAMNKHESVNQKYNGIYPYSLHLNMVVDNVINYAGNLKEELNMLISIAYLHDVLEDTRTTYNDLMLDVEICGLQDCLEVYSIVEAVYLLTNNKGRNRTERANEDYYNGIKSNRFAIIVKLCDRLANLTFSDMFQRVDPNCRKKLKMYSEENEHFTKMLGLDNLPLFSNLKDESEKQYYLTIKFLLNAISSKLLKKV